MTTQHDIKPLLTTVTFSGLAFFLVGFAVQTFAGPPAVTVLIDRSYCPATKWQQVTDDYAQIYRQHQLKQLKIEQVIFLSDLSESKAEGVPGVNAIATLKTYGQPNAQGLKSFAQRYSNSRLLSCQSDL